MKGISGRRSFFIVIWLFFLFALVLQAQDPLPLYRLPDASRFEPSSSGDVTALSEMRYAVSNPFNPAVSLIDIELLGVVESIATDVVTSGVARIPGEQRVITLSPTRREALLLDFRTDEVVARATLPAEPFAILARDGETAYVSFWLEDAVGILDLRTGAVRERIETPASPAGLALWGDFLYVTHFWSGAFSLIYLPGREVVTTIYPHPQASLSSTITIDPRTGFAYLPQSLSLAENAQPTVDNRVVPVLHVIDLATMQVQRRVDLILADRYVSTPYRARLGADGRVLYIVHAGSDDLTVLDLRTDLMQQHLDTGSQPRDVIVTDDHDQIFTYAAFDNQLTRVDLQFSLSAGTIPTLVEPTAARAQIGARLFHTAADARMSSNHLLNCASCHHGGVSDGRSWQGMLTPSLRDLNEVDAIFLNAHMLLYQGGSGLPIDSLDMEALIQYILEL